jgi:hypothetical protein
MKKLKNSAMLVVAVLCGYLALMTPDWKSDVVAAMNPGYQADYLGNHVAGWYWKGDSNGVETQNEIWTLTYPLYSSNWGVPTRAFPAVFPAQASWELVANGDFSHDNSSDVLWRNKTTGDWKVWQLVGGVRSSQSNLIYDASHQWAVVGVGDTDADGDDDVIMYNSTTGHIEIWEAQAASLTTHHDLGVVDAGYTPVRIGDFNGDGMTDIMIQSGTTLKIWQIQNNAFVTEQPGTTTGAGYTTLCAADGDGDGDSDLYLINTSTNQEKWAEMQNFARIAQHVGGDQSGFRFHACGDYDGDGDADVKWQRISDDQQRIVLQQSWGSIKQTVYTNIYGGQIPGGAGYGFVFRGSNN